ncbi:MAG TPA: hypothetical protein ENJ04_09610 [Nitrospirae bacterium]|nr:hypothetical protein [Nitrospirota bacterium]
MRRIRSRVYGGYHVPVLRRLVSWRGPDSAVSRLYAAAVCLLLLYAAGGCAPLLQRGDAVGGRVLAVVDGRRITEEDLRYSLQIAHRREDLSSAGELSLTGFVQKLIDDTLIIEEARRMGLDQDPRVRKSVDAFVLRESVVRLYAEEVSSRVSVSEEDLRRYYKKNYETFELGIIEVGSKEEAEGILEQLGKGADFRELAAKYSTDLTARNGGDIVLTRRSMPPDIGDAVAGLNPGEVSDVMRIRDKFYVVKLYSRKEAPDEKFDDVRNAVEKAVRKQKEQARADEYLDLLRKRASIRVDEELLASIDLDNRDASGEWADSSAVVAEVDGSVLTAGELLSMAASYRGKPKEYIVNSWVDRKVVDLEALRRHYDTAPDLKSRIERYEAQVLKQAFIDKVIFPQIKVSEQILRDYYEEHGSEFAGPERFRIQQITVASLDQAREILRSLEEGADFSWLAKERSIDSAAQEGGDAGWLVLDELPPPARDAVKGLEPGAVSPVFRVGDSYRVIRLLARAEGEVKDFAQVRDAVFKAYVREELKRLMDRYVSRLRAEARIRVYEDAVKSIEDEIRK